MYKYVIKRILLTIPVLLGAVFLVFTIMYLTPGDPGTLILGITAKPEDIAALNHKLGADLPFFEQFFNYLKGIILHFDFGTSYRSGKPVFDSILSRFPTTFQLALWSILLSLAVVAALGGSLRNLLIAITISCVPSMLRLVRSVVLGVVDEDYIEAARSYGASDMRIILKYVIPNALGPIIVTTTMNVANMILSAAGLSFLSLGVQPPAPEWGALLSDAKTYMFTAPHLLYIPGIFIVIAALSFNLAGDGLRDALDPKLKD